MVNKLPSAPCLYFEIEKLITSYSFTFNYNKDMWEYDETTNKWLSEFQLSLNEILLGAIA